ncbi:BED-type domain-containing protein [Citrus sinensis]|uniref:BED-type domain-containing protein n=1 Tax=Citrus sinensis TaxID=2711 RepID=A0ACB8M4X4_CITSI|nr:BED-type domain-containing protein [Citrus sinensis]
MKKRSAIWNHFTLLEDNPNKCMCNYCGKQYQCHSRLDGITNMTRHIKTCESYKTFRAQQSGSQQNLTSEGGEENASNLVLGKGWSQDACRRAVTKMIIMGELPLSFVDNKGFRHFCSVAIPQFVMPSRRTIGRDVMELFLEEKAMLKSLICNNKQRVSLTTDLWTSVQNMSYMVITAHFIDSDWCLNRRIISFSAIEDHRGKSIGKKIMACLQDWGIERLFAITVDNATANDSAVGYVTMQLLSWRNDDALVLAGQYMHVRCCAHILNLIVVSGLGELHASVTAIRNAVKYVRSSSMRLRTFKQCAEQVNCPKGIVVLDCPTRWNSTYLMLMTALKFQAAFDRMAEVDKPYEAFFAEKENNVRRVGPPGPDDWESAERIVKFLKVFYDATLLFSASLSVTSNLCYDTIGLIESSLIALQESTDPWVSSMAYMKDLLNEFYDAYSAFSASSTPSMYGESGLSGSYGGTSSSQRFTTEANLVDVAGGEYDDAFQVSRPFLGYARKVSVQNESRRVVSEVERYLKDPVEDPSNLKLNVLLWWRVNGSRYPILEKIARDVLAVPVSTVASESAFSTGRRIIDEYRSSLTPAMVEALICTENWLQSKLFANPVYNLQEDIKEQIFHMELQEELIRSQASTVEAVSADIGVMDD